LDFVDNLGRQPAGASVHLEIQGRIDFGQKSQDIRPNGPCCKVRTENGDQKSHPATEAQLSAHHV
jgi:hypothetical protein